MQLADEIQPAVFLLQMMRYLGAFKRAEAPVDLGSELRKLLARPGLSPEAKSVIYSELALYLSEKDELADQDKNDLLLALAFIERYPVPNDWKDPKTEDELRKTPYKISHRLQEHISSLPSGFIQEIVKTIYPEEPAKAWTLIYEGKIPVFTSGKSRYYPLQGALFLENAQNKTRPLPKAIIDYPSFQSLFPGQITGTQIAPFIYTFTVAGRQVLVKYEAESHTVTIEQNFEGKWACFVQKHDLLNETPEDIFSSLFSRSLVDRFSVWEIPDQKHLLLVDPNSQQIKYTGSMDGERLKIFRTADRAILSTSSPSLKRIERFNYIHEWYVGEKLQEIEFPRFDLTFTRSLENSSCFSCPHFEGFYLKPTATLPKLGVYSHYIVLENAKGEKKAIVPDLSFIKAQQPGYGFQDKGPVKLAKYIAFDVTPDGLLKSPSQEENLYAAEVFMAAEEYTTAANYLRRFGPKMWPYAENELYRLKTIAQKTEDVDPNAKAIRAYASYLVLKHGQGKESDLVQAAENFRYYLSNLKSVSALKLSREEEVFLLKTLLNHTFDPVFFLRLQELNPKALALLKTPDWSKLISEPKSVEFQLPGAQFLQHITHLSKEVTAPNPDTTLLTRLERDLKRQFLGYYEWARNASDQERGRLKTALAFNRNLKDHRLGNLLEVVLKYPEEFSAYPGKKVDYAWFAKLINKAQELYIQNPKEFQLERSYVATPPHIKSSEGVKKQLSGEAEKVSFELTCSINPFSELCQNLFSAKKQPHDAKPAQEITALLESWESSDNTFNSQRKHLIDDLAALEKAPPLVKYKLLDRKLGLKQLNAVLKKTDAEEKLSALEQQILTLANRHPVEGEELLSHELQVLSGVKKPLTLDELIINFGKQDLQFLQERNSFLSADDRAALYGKIGNYLLLATNEQQRARASALLSEVETSKSGSHEETENIQLLGDVLFARRCFDPKENPIFLVFEYHLNILIREQQKDKISKIQPNTVAQMLMGEGKTTVLFELLGQMRADGKNLSLLVLPEPLFASIAAYSQKVHLNSFGKQLRTLHFDRNTTFTKHSLEVILDNLKGAKKDRECLIMTSKSIACLILKYIELAITQSSVKTDEMQLMGKILALLGKNGYPLIDEIDTILKVLHEVSFSIGNQVPVDECEYVTIAELYDILYTNSEIKALARLESDPDPVKSAPVLTLQRYHSQIKDKLAQAFTARLTTMKMAAKPYEEKVQRYGQELCLPEKESERQLLIAYLCQDEERIKEAEAYYSSLEADLQNILRLASEEICRFLPYTLAMNSNENYGFSEHADLFAVPFAAADVPQEGSEYKNSHITMNTTFQMYMKHGISQKILMRTIEQLQQRALAELKEDPKLEITETNAWKSFEKIRGDLEFPLLKYNQAQLKALLNRINCDISSKTSFVINAILPHIIRYDSSLTFNPQNFISFFDQSSGFSGTLANALTMYYKLKIMAEPGTDAKTLKTLFEKSRIAVKELKSDSIAEVLDMEKLDFDVLTDAGGYCKGKESSSMQIAHKLAVKTDKPVVIYDKKGIKQEVRAKGVALFKDNLEPGRKTVFDQSRSTGGDIKQGPTAKAVITIGKNLTTRDLFQAARRMRGLDRGQTVSFWISPEVGSIIREVCKKTPGVALDFDDILFFAVHNQSRQLGSEYFKSFKQQLWNISQMMLLKAVISASLQGEEAEAAQEMLKMAWCRSSNKLPKELYGPLATEVDSKDAVREEMKRCSAFIQECFNKLPSLTGLNFSTDQCAQEMKAIKKRFVPLLPSRINIQQLDDNQTTEQEVESETQQETETDMESEEHAEAQGIKLETKSIKKLNPITTLKQSKVIEGNYLPLELYFRSRPELAEYAGAFSGISMTINVLQFTSKTPTPDNLELFGPHRTPLHNFAMDINGSMLLLSRKDISWDSKNEFKKKKYLLDNLTLCDCESAKFDEAIRPAIFEKIVKCKFLNGECNFNKQEQRVLENWIKDAGTTKMRKLYLKHILAGFPLKKEIYNANSDLKRLFKKLEAG